MSTIRFTLINLLLFLSVICSAQKGGQGISGETQWYLVQCSTKPSGQYIAKIDSVLKFTIGANVYDSLDVVMYFAQNLQANALIPLNNPNALNSAWPTTMVNTNSMSFTAGIGGGFKSNGTTSYLNSHITYKYYTLNNVGIGIYCQTQLLISNSADYGVYDGTNQTNSNLGNASNSRNGEINNISLFSTSNSVTTGFFYNARISSTTVKLWYNGSLSASITSASVGIPNNTMLIGAEYNNGSAAFFVARLYSNFFLGANITQSKAYAIAQTLR